MTNLQTEVQHVLLTRYNLPVPGQQKNLQPEWLETRQNLFDQYCVPSVMNQSNKDFLWLILTDARTPKKYIAGLSAIAPANARITQLETPLDDTPPSHFLAAAGVTEASTLLTSRLDSDDCLGVDYMKIVRNASEQHLTASTTKVRTAFNFPLGLQVRRSKVYGLVDTDNPFLSLLEYPGQHITALAVSHREIRSIASLRQIRSGPQWLQVVHDNNLDNTIRGVRLPSRIMRKSFRDIETDLARPADKAIVDAPRRAASLAGQIAKTMRGNGR